MRMERNRTVQVCSHSVHEVVQAVCSRNHIIMFMSVASDPGRISEFNNFRKYSIILQVNQKL